MPRDTEVERAHSVKPPLPRPSRFVDPENHGLPSSSGKYFREFHLPDSPPSWLGSENESGPVDNEVSSDEDAPALTVRHITHQQAPAIPLKAILRADKDGWYNWEIPPAVSQTQPTKLLECAHPPSNTKQSPSPQLEPEGELAIVDYITPAGAAGFDLRPVTVDIGFLEEFDEFLNQSDPSQSYQVSEQLADPPLSLSNLRVSLPKIAPSIEPPSGTLDTSQCSTEDTSTADDGEGDPPPGGLLYDGELEVATREELETSPPGPSGHDTRSAEIPINIRSTSDQSDSVLNVEVFTLESFSTLNTDCYDETQWQLSEDEASSGPASSFLTEANNEEVLHISPALPNNEHSREQSQRLRLYSTLYADFARDPWKWHDRRDLVREVFPNLELEAIEEGRHARGGRDPAYANGWDRFSSPRPDQQQNGHLNEDHRTEQQHGRTPNPRTPGTFDVSGVPDLTRCNLNRENRPVVRQLLPLENEQYCEKCKQHFPNTWRMQSHLTGSRRHPYYCQICTIDYRSFRELYMVSNILTTAMMSADNNWSLQHYAEQPKCRPPELEFGPAKPFLQILAEYQVTGQKDAACQKSAAEASVALAETQSRAGPLPPPAAHASPMRNANRANEAPVCPICMVSLMHANEVLVTACG